METVQENLARLSTAELLSMSDQLAAQWQTLHHRADVAAMQMMLNCNFRDAIIDVVASSLSWLRDKTGMGSNYSGSPLHAPINAATDNAKNTLQKLQIVEEILRGRGVIK